MSGNAGQGGEAGGEAGGAAHERRAEYAYAGIQLRERVSVVTGGTRGLGRAIARGFAREGATVVAASRNRERVEATARELAELGSPTLAQTLDVRRRESVEALIEAVVERFGRLDILVHAAGIVERMPLAEMTDEAWDRVMEVNLKGTFLTNQAAARAMIAGGNGGRIINIASMTSYVSVAHVASYAASKGGLLSLTRVAAHEWGPHGITVNAIAPGFFITELNRATLEPGSPRRVAVEARTPLARLGGMEELVGAAVYLASDAARYVTGICLPVDGGFLAKGVD